MRNISCLWQTEMKVCIVLILAACAVASWALPSDGLLGVERQFLEFRLKHNKNYENELEEARRLKVFRDNLKKIEAHNKKYEAGETTYQMGVGVFADWTSTEFMQYVNKSGFKSFADGSETVPKTYYKLNKNVKAPASIDWREKGAVNGVKNQGSCGSCWAFGAIAALEGQHKVKHGELLSLSEQNLVDCADTGGCSGGGLKPAYDYFFYHGIEKESDYPYEAKDGDCRFDEGKSVLKIKGITYVAKGSEATLEVVVGDEGPLGAGIQVTDNFQHYSSGVFYDDSCGHDQRNHAIGVVGYSNLNGVDYWLVRNSWGDGWGQGGYIYMARKRDNNCDIAADACFPTF